MLGISNVHVQKSIPRKVCVFESWRHLKSLNLFA